MVSFSCSSTWEVVMSVSFEQYRLDLIGRGLHRAADRLVAVKSSVTDVVVPSVVDGVVDNTVGKLKVHCSGPRSCENFSYMVRGKGSRWFCADHSVNIPEQVAPSVLVESFVLEPVESCLVFAGESSEVALVDDQPSQLRYRGHVYTPHVVNFDGVAFKLKNGNTVTLDPSRVEWV